MATAIVRPTAPDVLLVGDPQEMLDSARKVANVLVKLVEERQLYETFGGKRHLLVEAWQTVAHFYGVTAKIVTVDDWTDEVTGEQGFEAWAEAIHASTGRVISAASAICLNNEENWSTRPKYKWEHGEKHRVGDVLVPRFQLMSMAQTRAISKVLRNVFAFVVVLAGFDPTPAAEMTGSERQPQEKQTPANPQVQQKDEPKRISDKERKRIFAIGYEKNIPMPEIIAILKQHGFAMAAHVTTDKYAEVCRALENYKK